jgi:hypothetical protein
VEGVSALDLVRAPHRDFYRRRGVPAFAWVGTRGQRFDDVESYVKHLTEELPESYSANRDFRDFVENLSRVAAGEVTAEQAAARMPELRRVGGTCPCSKAVRWVREDSALPASEPANA